MKQIFLDTETTGLSPGQGHRIVEIAAVLCEEREVVREFHTYLNPQMPMPEDTLQVHGLDDDFLADKPLFADIADDLIAFVSGCQVIMHNAPFDTRFLDAELQAAGKPPLGQIASRVLCSLKWARANGPDLESYNLRALCNYYDIPINTTGLHGAREDARALRQVYYRMGGR